jgi:hypothetical protein
MLALAADGSSSVVGRGGDRLANRRRLWLDTDAVLIRLGGLGRNVYGRVALVVESARSGCWGTSGEWQSGRLDCTARSSSCSCLSMYSCLSNVVALL